jgi:hypothetical protein
MCGQPLELALQEAGRAPERRHLQRNPLVLPVELESGTGQTRDISASGVFFETDQSFAIGSPISFSLVLAHMHGEAPLRLQCEGKIVRIERRSGKVGVAVAIMSYR